MIMDEGAAEILCLGGFSPTLHQRDPNSNINGEIIFLYIFVTNVYIWELEYDNIGTKIYLS